MESLYFVAHTLFPETADWNPGGSGIAADLLLFRAAGGLWRSLTHCGGGRAVDTADCDMADELQWRETYSALIS